jgi:hypothetical protein
MAVQLRSITGKVDYEVEQVIRDLVLAVNRLDAVDVPDVAAILAALTDLGTRVGLLEQRVQVQEQKIAALEAAP